MNFDWHALVPNTLIPSTYDFKSGWFYLYSTISQAFAAIFAIVVGSAFVRLQDLATDYERQSNRLRDCFQNKHLGTIFQKIMLDSHHPSTWKSRRSAAVSLVETLSAPEGTKALAEVAIEAKTIAESMHVISESALQLRRQMKRTLLFMTIVIAISTCMIPFGSMATFWPLAFSLLVTVILMIGVVIRVRVLISHFVGDDE